jgi:thioredoxin reductase (NADPH)
MTTTEIENYPGFPDGIEGPQLMMRKRAQAERFGAQMLRGKATGVSKEDSIFSIRVDTEGEPILSRAVIVATGARSRLLGLPEEERLFARGIHTCATCDGPLPVFRNQPLAVVGGGDSALEEAMFLSRFASIVHLIHRRDELRASKFMQQRAAENPQINFIWNSVVTEALDGGMPLKGVRLRDLKRDEESVLDVRALFVAIGQIPNTDIFQGLLDMDESGYLVTQAGSTASNVPGIFVAGDVEDHKYRQAITAAGDGCKAAIDAERWLELNPA